MIDLYSGVRVVVVDPGTVVGQDKDGVDMVVTDEAAVFRGGTVWLTQQTYDMMKETPK